MTAQQRLIERAAALDAAACSASPIALRMPGWAPTLEEGYAIQRELVARRTARGERVIGVKMALTDAGRRARMGVAEPPLGVLTDAMRMASPARLGLARCIRPRIEAEVAFVLARPLAGEVGLDEALDSIAAAMPAIEIIDGRTTPAEFSLADMVADNASACAFVLGAPRPAPAALDRLAVSVQCNGREVFAGSTAAISGHPARSLCDAARLAARFGIALPAGAIVLAGSACEPMPLEAGAWYSVEVEGLGSARLETRAA